MQEAIRTLLRLEGPRSTRELVRALGVSQPTISRGVRALGEAVLAMGQGASRRYALRRPIDGIETPIPIYELGNPPRQLASLHPAHPRGFYVEAESEDVESKFYPDLPWFLSELRPSGWLGRQIPARHPDLAAPPDIRFWSADHVLRWATRYGWDVPGALIVGNKAFELFLADAHATPPDRGDRGSQYLLAADASRRLGPVGSSAGGEFPKFLAIRAPRTPVLVKYSPPLDSAIAQRWADLLVAEHHALTVCAGPRSETLTAGNRMFLEVERFDRRGAVRVGQIALEVLDAEFVGRLTTWRDAAAGLRAGGLISAADERAVRWRSLFGAWIGNSDMHGANLAFYLDGTRIAGIAPVYDMLPMRYAPVGGELADSPFDPPLPRAEDEDVAASALAAAVAYWQRLAADPGISCGFAAIARENADRVGALHGTVRLLPPRGSE